MAREKVVSSKSAKAKAADLLAQIGNQPSPIDDETRKTRLKTLIKLGKERGFLTYAEVNDHLPDDVVDAEFDGAVKRLLEAETRRTFEILKQKVAKLGLSGLSSEEKQQYVHASNTSGRTAEPNSSS